MEDNVLEKIYKSGLKLLEPLDTQKIYETIVQEGTKLVDGDEGKILLRQDEEFNLVYAHPAIAADIPKVRKKGFTFRAFTKQIAFIIDMAKYPRVHPQISRRGVKSALFIPLSYKKQAIGVLVVQSYKDKIFTERQLDVLKLFGSLASLAIRKTQLYEETRIALELRNDFIELAAHELRTPLTSLTGYIQLLNNKMSGQESVEANWARQLLIEGNRLSNLVSELLEVNRINSGKFRLELKECRLAEIIKKVIEKRQLTTRTEIYFQKNADNDLIVGDSEKLTVVFDHILDNAIKFSDKERKINLTLKEKGGFLGLIIRDYGQGIASEDLKKIVERFYKGKNVHSSGMGLGLFLSNVIIERHRGSIKIDSKLNKGTTVEIKLPKVKYDGT